MEKTTEQLMREFREQPATLVSSPPDHRTLALKAAMTLPNGSARELLAVADKIEGWLNEPTLREQQTRENWINDGIVQEIILDITFTMTERPSTDGSPFPEVVTTILPPAAVEK